MPRLRAMVHGIQTIHRLQYAATMHHGIKRMRCVPVQIEKLLSARRAPNPWAMELERAVPKDEAGKKAKGKAKGAQKPSPPPQLGLAHFMKQQSKAKAAQAPSTNETPQTELPQALQPSAEDICHVEREHADAMDYVDSEFRAYCAEVDAAQPAAAKVVAEASEAPLAQAVVHARCESTAEVATEASEAPTPALAQEVVHARCESTAEFATEAPTPALAQEVVHAR
jgi:hypothetical protein